MKFTIICFTFAVLAVIASATSAINQDCIKEPVGARFADASFDAFKGILIDATAALASIKFKFLEFPVRMLMGSVFGALENPMQLCPAEQEPSASSLISSGVLMTRYQTYAYVTKTVNDRIAVAINRVRQDINELHVQNVAARMAEAMILYNAIDYGNIQKGHYLSHVLMECQQFRKEIQSDGWLKLGPRVQFDTLCFGALNDQVVKYSTVYGQTNRNWRFAVSQLRSRVFESVKSATQDFTAIWETTYQDLQRAWDSCIRFGNSCRHPDVAIESQLGGIRDVLRATTQAWINLAAGDSEFELDVKCAVGWDIFDSSLVSVCNSRATPFSDEFMAPGNLVAAHRDNSLLGQMIYLVPSPECKNLPPEWNDEISSLTMTRPTGSCPVFYTEPGCTGLRYAMPDTANTLPTTPLLNNAFSSYRDECAVTVFHHANFKGTRMTLFPIATCQSLPAALNDQISSVRSPNTCVNFFQHGDCTGTSTRFNMTSSTSIGSANDVFSGYRSC